MGYLSNPSKGLRWNPILTCFSIYGAIAIGSCNRGVFNERGFIPAAGLLALLTLVMQVSKVHELHHLGCRLTPLSSWLPLLCIESTSTPLRNIQGQYGRRSQTGTQSIIAGVVIGM